MGGNLRGGGIRYRGTTTSQYTDSQTLTTLKSVTGNGVLKNISTNSPVIILADGVIVYSSDVGGLGIDHNISNIPFNTSLELRGNNMCWVIQNGNNKYDLDIGYSGNSVPAALNPVSLSVTGRGYINRVYTQPQSSQLVVDGQIIRNESTIGFTFRNIFYETGFSLHSTSTATQNTTVYTED